MQKRSNNIKKADVTLNSQRNLKKYLANKSLQ